MERSIVGITLKDRVQNSEQRTEKKKTLKKLWSMKEIFKSCLPHHLKQKVFDIFYLLDSTYSNFWMPNLEPYHKRTIKIGKQSIVGITLKDRVQNNDLRKRF